MSETLNLPGKIKEILRKSGITDIISDVAVKSAEKQGEGLLSLAQLATVTFANPKLEALHLFVKVHTGNDAHSKWLEEMKAFQKESVFLTSYYQAAADFCKGKGHPEFTEIYPKCYYGDEKLVVLEDLTKKCYQVLNKDVKHNLETARTVMKTLATHHGLAHVLIQEFGGPSKFFQKFPNLDHEPFDKPTMVAKMEQTYASSFNNKATILETSAIPGAAEAAAKLRTHYLPKTKEEYLECLKAGPDDLLVLGHGDVKNVNMMFLPDSTEMAGNILIDFQMTQYKSVGLDLGFYFYMSVDTKIRQKHLKDLLQLYVTSFNEVTEKLGMPANWTYEKVFEQFRKKLGFGLWLGFSLAVGPGMSILKGVDLSKVDMRNWVQFFQGLMRKWMDENPEKVKETAEEVLSLLKEYEQLKL